eukprot:TRINITY_DN4415_c0_g1_i1.p1 TRINITY_DN4415_c0_g1~~TRINITY_DN4415_c0_g1_i1.p1  ORF type:complete len:428 (+),score=67.22 TRINITY_DN4415_c0_g1_i1:212-1495(+)
MWTSIIFPFAFASLAAADCPFSGSNDAPPAWHYANYSDQIPMAGDVSDPLVRFNNAFHLAYTNAGTIVRPTPLLLIEGDYLVLWTTPEDRQMIGTYTPPIYHNLKMVSHIPLALSTALQPLFDDKLNLTQGYPGRPNADAKVCLTPYVRQTLSELVANLSEVTDDDFDQRFKGTAAPINEQKIILNDCKAFGQAVLDANETSLNDIIAFTSKHQDILKNNLELAAGAQVDMLHSRVNAIEAMLGSNASKMVVGVTTSIMAKNQSLVSQYFSRRYGVPTNHNQRFYVMEEVSTEPDNLNLMSTHVLDSVSGNWFFGDTYRLWRDALSDGARDALNRLFPNTAPSSSTPGMLTSQTPAPAQTLPTTKVPPSQTAVKCDCASDRLAYLWMGIAVGLIVAALLVLVYKGWQGMLDRKQANDGLGAPLLTNA